MDRALADVTFCAFIALAVQHFASIIPDLAQCFTAEELTDVTIAFCDAIAPTKSTITINKLLLLAQLVNGPLVQDAESRSTLIPHICRWLKPHLGTFDELKMFSSKESEASKQSLRIVWLEGIRLSVSVVATLLDKLHAYIVDGDIAKDRNALSREQDSIEYLLSLLPRLVESYRELSLPINLQTLQNHRGPASAIESNPVTFPSTYPTSLLVELPPSPLAPEATQVATLQHVSGEVAATIVSLLHISPAKVLADYMQTTFEIEGAENFSALLSQLFRAMTSMLAHQAYPASWLNISMLTHTVALRIAEPAASILQREYIPSQQDAASFRPQLWRDFFDMLLKLLSSPLLVIEDFSPARQRAVWRLAGDLRGAGSDVLLKSWEALSWPELQVQNAATAYGGYQVGMSHMVRRIGAAM